MVTFQKKPYSFSQIANGNKEAFDTFFKEYYPKLVQFARYYVYSEQQAEDVVADVLTKMLINRDRVFGLKHFEAYLYSSIKNQALSSLKKGKNTDGYPSNIDLLQPSPTDPYETLVGEQLLEHINKIIHLLPPKRKMVFQLIREEGFSYRQVAELMEISERTVEVHLKLAVKTLRKEVENYLSQKKERHFIKSMVEFIVPILFFSIFF